MELKRFQKDARDALRSFLERARAEGPAAAFSALAPKVSDSTGLLPEYRPLKGLEAVPYVCLRLPTGGGKTILAAHCIRVAAESYMDCVFPLTLWLVPSRTIKDQTLEALKKAGHPYRQALDDAFGGNVRLFDIADVTQIRPTDLADRACIVVGTLQTGRVQETENREIYAHDENFEPHFRGPLPGDRSFERHADGPYKGQVKFSFANLLKLHRPLVITDEAHNADSKLTYTMYERYNPACVVEFTATPDYAHSNVLYRVSAFELKHENLIKLPVMLTEHPRWEDAVQGALATRRVLAEAAKGETEPVRPIVLFQAENKDRNVTVEVLKKHLIEQERIEPEKIAVVTGDQRELDQVNLFDPACPIECIITVQALKEGWDCSFAYVFCSVANIASATAVEQLLGRVLRMPYAKRRKEEALNRAYAHVSSPTFAAAAKALRDRMVSRMGFEEEEADDILRATTSGTDRGFSDLPLFQPARFTALERPPVEGFGGTDRDAVEVRPTAQGGFEVTVNKAITDACADSLVAVVAPEQRAEVEQKLAAFRRSTAAEGVQRITVPRLCAWVQGDLELVVPSLFLEAGGWNLLDYPAELPGFRYEDESRGFTLDVEGRKVVLGSGATQAQPGLPGLPPAFTALDAIRFLDRNVPHPDIPQSVMIEYLRRVVDDLTAARGLSLPLLDRAKFLLRRAVEQHIEAGRQAARLKGVQALLFAPEAKVEASLARAFHFDPNPLAYPATTFDRGWKARKHLYPHVAAFDSDEEKTCAMQLDVLPQVERWVRNLDQKPDHAFWLPVAWGRFYPDFVARLVDGRILVVEYKGAGFVTTEDTKAKHRVGELWERVGARKHLFLLATERDAVGRDLRSQLLFKIDAQA